jgi:cell adhesion molecule 2
LFIFSEIKCVRLLKIIIPAYRFRNENAMLECDFELDKVKNDETYADEDLYSVKWYKDNEEFYRYVPRANPPQNSYKVDGIKVDVSGLCYVVVLL